MNGITDLLYSQNEQYDNQGVPGFVQGVVVENNNKEFKGMVKVEFTVWEKGKNACEWVRLLSPYTGASYGSYVVPEIDEIVLVGFIGGSLKRPFLLGSLYPADAAIVGEKFDEKNLMKAFKTKAGTEVLFNDESGKESITITTPKGSTIIVEDEKESCTISDKGAKNGIVLDYKGGAIDITAEKTINLKAGSVKLTMNGNANSCEISAKDITLKANNNVTIKATNNASIEATNAGKLKGLNVTVEGSVKAEVKGSANTTISGGMVKIN